jgi:hypothetical protein
MTERRECAHCGADFEPRREHARFCSARCRVAWNRENAGDLPVRATALGWSVAAMQDATGRVLRVRAADQTRAFAVIAEAVWWVTIVDATLVRYHPDSYDEVLSRPGERQRMILEETLGGLRFVRNQMGYHLDPADFVCPAHGAAPGARLTGWRWKPVPEPALGSLPPSNREWERARYEAYQASLAGRTVAEVFSSTSAFLREAAAMADPAAGSLPA